MGLSGNDKGCGREQGREAPQLGLLALAHPFTESDHELSLTPWAPRFLQLMHRAAFLSLPATPQLLLFPLTTLQAESLLQSFNDQAKTTHCTDGKTEAQDDSVQVSEQVRG